MENYNSPMPAFGSGLFLTFGFFGLLTLIAFWRIFTKAGKPGWAAIIPIYNLIVLLEIVGKPVWWFLLMLLPCVNFVFIIWTYNLLSKSFGKTEGFTVGLILLNPIFIMILGFGDAVYLGPSAKEAYADNRFGATDYQKPFDPQP
ncbi:DUF5684 domain-containing protein [Mucilaginibacter paludis]|uniref:Signal peptidase I n=1 Tax=Mucilaginibacter paludis DSM 18603 TaxID=714943 RepID=H1Y4Y3_9SPHI|nr:DUF5684 domain-containing protein [Mucilaginibacter paludis]EHQ28311.1 hypothetical protein Mucpa_4220 [Mucilaginibacter paludis DSM 18603]